MTITETLTTIAVLLGIFLLAYMAIRQKDLMETIDEIKTVVTGKADEAKEKVVYG